MTALHAGIGPCAEQSVFACRRFSRSPSHPHGAASCNLGVHTTLTSIHGDIVISDMQPVKLALPAGILQGLQAACVRAATMECTALQPVPAGQAHHHDRRQHNEADVSVSGMPLT